MFINPMLPFIIYQRWLETVVLPVKTQETWPR